MKIQIRVENHQPVPLIPLQDVIDNSDDPCEAVYLGWTVWEENSEEEELGWGVLSQSTIQWFDGSYTFVDMLNTDLTMARRLQPGERLVVTIEG